MNMRDTQGNEVPEKERHGLPDSVSDEELVKEIMDSLKRSRDHRSEWRSDAHEDYEFFAGRQWEEEDISSLEEQGRPVVVFNRIVRTINAVSGVEVQNRQEVRYFPRKVDQSPPPAPPGSPPMPQPNDSMFSDIMNDAGKWVRDQNDAEDEESESFQDCLICGEGWTETRMDYERDPQGMIIKDRIDPLYMLVDECSKKRNYEDARWVAYIKDYPLKEAQEMFPDIDVFTKGQFWGEDGYRSGGGGSGGYGDPHDADNAWKYENESTGDMAQPSKVSVIIFQCYKVVPAYILLAPEGKTVILESNRYAQAKPYLDMLGVKPVKSKMRKYHQYIVAGGKLAEKSEIRCQDFTLKCMTGIRDRNNGTWFGLVSLMKDPQRWANKWLSQVQHILNSNAKGGYFVEVGAINNMRKFEEEAAKPNSITLLNQGGLAKVQEKKAPPYPDGIDRLLNYAVQAVNDIPGVNLEMLGQTDRDQPIGLERERKMAGITVLANFFDALRRYRKSDGRILASFIRDYMADGRLIRIVGDNGSQYIPLVRDRMAFSYDIVVDDSPTSPNVKDRNFAILMQLIPIAMQAQIPIPPDILEYAPLPEDLIQKWKAMLQPDPQEQARKQKMQQIQDELAQLSVMQAQLDIQQSQADIEKTGSESQKNMAQAEKDMSVGQEQSALAMQKFGIIGGDHELKAQQMAQDQNRKDIELAMNQRRKMLEVQLDALIRANKNVTVPSLATIQ